MCSSEPINCFPVLVNIISNAFLGLLNSTARIRIWSEIFLRTQSPHLKHYIFYNCFDYLLVLAAGLPPLFAVSSMEDYKVKSTSC
ncbi:ABCA8 protein, partial [Scytalopus superciliaris]|nr:ABCA8 protein [Scytalopus superciliaris]